MMPTLDDRIDVSVCIANWNCRDVLRGCLASLLRQPQRATVEVVVVDNASTDGAPAMVAAEFPEVTLVRNRKNVGFARASNQAAARARGRHLFFLNNDTVVPAGALGELVAYADAHPDVGMVGPRLRDAAGKMQISYRRRPTLGALLHRTLLLRWTGLARQAYHDYRRDTFDPDRERAVEVLMGAAILMPRQVFAECGPWDEAFTFGVEDVDLSVRVGQQYPLMYVPRIEITHFGRVSSRQNIAFIQPGLETGYYQFLRKSGAGEAALFGYKLAITLDVPVQIAVKGCQYLWRRLRGETAKAHKTRLAMEGAWVFLTRGLRRFWFA